MTTFYAFQPSNQGPFQFDPILDGKSYLAVVTWNLFGQRWFLNLYDGAGNRIITKALIGSPTGVNIQSLEWDLQGEVTITTIDPHGYKIGSTTNLTIAGTTPAAFNGKRLCLATGPNTLTYPQGADPGPASVMGSINYDIDLIWGYGFDSTLVFRDASQQFGVTP